MTVCKAVDNLRAPELATEWSLKNEEREDSTSSAASCMAAAHTWRVLVSIAVILLAVPSALTRGGA
jgi:hypothetical protein